MVECFILGKALGPLDIIASRRVPLAPKHLDFDSRDCSRAALGYFGATDAPELDYHAQASRR